MTDRPYAEVFVATSPALFREDQAALRTPATWLASRAHGMLRGPGEITYMLPAAFVASAVRAQPRPTKLYFLAAAYTSESGSDPVWSIPQSEWGKALPFVEIGADLAAPAIATTLGIALERLTRAIGADTSGNGNVSLGQAVGALEEDVLGEAFTARPSGSGVVWRQEATGTLGRPRVARQSDVDDGAHPSEHYGEDYRNALIDAAHPKERYGERYRNALVDAAHPKERYGERYRNALVDGAEDEEPVEAEAYGAEHDEEHTSDDFVYDDGHGPQAARGMDSVHPTGAELPEDLPEDEEAYGDEASWQASATSGNARNALDVVLDEVARTRNGTLYGVVRATQDDGLAFGVLQATQRSGELGRVLDRLKTTDAAAFVRFFGGATTAEELLSVTKGESEAHRMRPVGGRPLVDATWRRAFEEAGAHPPFVEAQRAYARARMLEPLVPIARDLGLGTLRGLAVLACVLVGKGLEGGMRWILSGIAPVTTPAQTTSALAALGHADLAAFQRAEGIRVSGELDVASQARLTKALRQLGPRSPVPVLAPAQMIQTLVRQASTLPFHAKLEAIVSSRSLDDRDI